MPGIPEGYADLTALRPRRSWFGMTLGSYIGKLARGQIPGRGKSDRGGGHDAIRRVERTEAA